MAKKPSKVLRAPFLITFAGAAIMVPACSSEIITNPPLPVCPDSPPAEGEACGDEGMGCTYDACKGTLTAMCTSNGWSLSSDDPTCNPQCPASPPASSSACTAAEVGLTCTYPDSCVGQLTFTCVAAEMSAFWSDTSPPCNPPPPQPCYTLTTQTDCSFGLNCRWVEPGCGDSPIMQAQCVDNVQCTSDTDCGPGEACKTLSVLPECAQSGCNPCCNACDEQLKICM